MEKVKMPSEDAIELIKCKYCEDHSICDKCYYRDDKRVKHVKSENKKFWEEPRS